MKTKATENARQVYSQNLYKSGKQKQSGSAADVICLLQHEEVL